VPHTHAGPVPAPTSSGRGRARYGWARRAGWTAATVVAFSLAAGPVALAQPTRQAAAAATAPPAAVLSVTIESVSPRWAAPGHIVTVRGIVTNGTGAAQAGVSVLLRSSALPLSNRDDLTSYAAGTLAADAPEGSPVPLPGVIAPGRSVHWKVTLNPAEVGMTVFGVYPLAAQVLNSAGMPASTDRTFLPFWPGGAAAQQPQRLSVAWVWPVIDQPWQVACPGLLSDGLTASLSRGGRLDGLVTAGATYSAQAHLTWAIDPALLANARTLSTTHATGGSAVCSGTRTAAGSRTARTWLTRLTSAVAGQQVFLTPYGDVDAAALSHDGLDTDLTSAYTLGRTVGHQILGRPASAGTIAWPDNGQADSGVLGSLASDGIKTVVLDSTVMPPAGVAPSYTPSAQTSAASGLGTSMRVLLADHTISHLLASTATGPGAAFATEQSFLAQTAMIVAEAPALSRSVVVAPPQRWDPAPGLASSLLQETTTAPWLTSTSLAALAAVTHPSGQVARHGPPAHRVARAELNPVYLGQVGKLAGVAQLQGSIFSPADPDWLAGAIAALESSAWRGPPLRGERRKLLGLVSGYLQQRARKVQIIDSGHVTLSGASGKVPVSVVNQLPGRTVKVRLRAIAPADGRLTVGNFDPLVTIPAGKTMTIRVPVHSTAIGVTEVTLELLTPSDQPLPQTEVQLSVHATRFGRLALIVMAVALGVFVLTAAVRAVRRSRRGGEQTGGHASDPPGTAIAGSVGSGDDLANEEPPEDPDEYADARGRARR